MLYKKLIVTISPMLASMDDQVAHLKTNKLDHLVLIRVCPERLRNKLGLILGLVLVLANLKYGDISFVVLRFCQLMVMNSA